MRSIRNRMIVYVLAGGGLLLAAGATFLQVRIGDVLQEGFDDALVSKVSALATLVTVDPESYTGIEFNFGDEFMPEFEDEDGAEYFQLVFADGRPIEHSKQLGLGSLGFRAGGDAEPVLRDLVLPDGRRGRAVELDFIPQNEGEDFGPWIGDSDEEVHAGVSGATRDFEARFPGAGVTLVLARSREGLDRDMGMLRVATVSVNLAILVGLGLVLLAAGRMVTRPMTRIGRDLMAIDPSSITSRVELDGCPREIAPLVVQVNAMLERFQAGLEREKRFSSDVAHELRSPVTKLRLMAEVAGMDPHLADEQREVFDDLDEAARRLESIVHGLLLISRAESGGGREDLEAVGIMSLVEGVAQDAAAALAERGMGLHLKGSGDCTWVVDPAHFTIALSNLVENAASHGAAGTPIEISWGESGGTGQVRVRNAVTGLEQAELDHLFDRFWRKDPARPSDGHFGLGLSIVRAVCELLGWKARARLVEGGLFEVELSGMPVAVEGE
ncbi:MAG: histidine kinase dimerization/phospho-acceptor domain-containing protein [Planctomycetota bacterium]|nr:histidine kinase dimerization/phospho-acceptor domain-containing protein [Planctomycetota bacterium]